VLSQNAIRSSARPAAPYGEGRVVGKPSECSAFPPWYGLRGDDGAGVTSKLCWIWDIVVMAEYAQDKAA